MESNLMNRTNGRVVLVGLRAGLALCVISCDGGGGGGHGGGSSGGGGSGDGGPTTGRFADHISCEVTAPPPEAQLDGYYKKYLNCTGIPVIGSDAITDEALWNVSDLIDFMMTGRNEVKDELVRVGAYHVLVPSSYSPGLTEAPEFSGLSLNGSGNTLRKAPVSVSAMPNALCDPDGNVNGFVGANVAMHELTHLMHLHAFRTLYPDFEPALGAAFQHAVSTDLWKNTFLRMNDEEYLAAGVTVWYGTLTSFVVGAEGDGTLNDVNTRAELKAYDPDLYDLLARFFNPAQDVPGCLTPTL
jgi:hypothetical protein